MTVISSFGQVILLTLSFAGSAASGPATESGGIIQTAQSDQEKLGVLIDNLFDSYRKEDLDAHALLWAADSPELADLNSSLKQFFAAYDQIAILDEKILRLSILGNRAGMRVSYRVRAIEGGTGRPFSGDGLRYETIICRKDGSDWKILSIKSTASLVLEQVLKSGDDRNRLLDAEREWLTTSLIINEGGNLLAGGRAGEAYVIATLAMSRSEKDGDIAGHIGALELLSAVNAEKGDYQASIDDLKRILIFDKVRGSNVEAGRIWNEIGKIHNRFGDYRAAAEAFELALDLREKTGDQIQIAILQNNLGSMYRMLGDYRRAMELLNRCLANSKTRARALHFRALINLGNVYGAQGNHEQALKSYLESIRISEEMGSLNDVATTWNNIGTAYSAQGRYREALDAYQRSRQVHESIQNERGAATAIHNIGSLYLHQDKYDEALTFLIRGLELREKHQNMAHIASSLTGIGRAWHGSGKFTEALNYLSRAVDLARRSGDQDLLRRCLTQAGETSLAAGRIEDAAGSFTEAIGIIERMRTSVAGPPRDQQLFFENKLDPYRGMVRLSVGNNRFVDAFEYAERARARVLLDVLRDENRLELAHTGLKSRRGVFSPLTQTEAMGLLPDRDYALLEYSISEAGSFLFVLTRDERDAAQPRLEIFPIRISSGMLEEKTALFRRRLSERDPGFARLALELYQILLKPAEAALSGKTRLVIVPDGCLWEMPFQALMPVEGRFLIESAVIFFAPSLTTLSNMVGVRSVRNAGSRRPGSLLGIGNPAWDPADHGASFEPLPEAWRQVREIGKLYGSGKSRIFTGRTATESRFNSEAPKYDILHLATHGVVDDAGPLYSYLLLARSGKDESEDGLLEAREVMNLELKARLAVLSACETARGHIGAGEGVVGLAWSFFIAGVPTIAVSQWKVRSDSTADLMIEFHRRLAGKAPGKSSLVAEALRDASLKVMKMKGYRHPFYWAGFILVGDGY